MKHLTDLACPKNISSFWSFGSLLGLCLATQIATGIFLAMYYASDVSLAFDSVTYISRDVSNGWLIRSIHANSASFFFMAFYLHIGRGIYYSSYTMWKTWVSGVTLFLLAIVTAFMGYVLPWGQMSYWAATVITNLVSTVPYVGQDLVIWLWGGFSVNNATLVRFYALHFLMPFVMAAGSLAHIFFLHEKGSSNPIGMCKYDYIKFHPYFTYKDLTGFMILWMLMGSVVMFYPNMFIDPENFMKANPLVTPTHIQPEWYFLPMYAILRSVPNKLGGVIALLMSVAILYFLPLCKPKYTVKMFYTQIMFWWFCSMFSILLWIGSKPVEYPFETIGQIFSIFYFLYFSTLFVLN
uniref:Cytochrome b n=1 Tax=Membranipora grandicella TaxID=192923 RepID=I6M1A1_9BILA|nr:cytochrome b [Membranipora grandicella]AEH99610.1 cytochrome b [Membranipora grandicella]